MGNVASAPVAARRRGRSPRRSRRRRLLSKTALLAAGTLLAGAVASVVVMWWRSPYDTLEGRIGPSSFDIEGLVVPAYALYALGLGVLAGLVFRRTVAAMTATLVAFGATRFLVIEFMRPHFLTPLHRVVLATDTGRSPGDWVLSDTLVDGGGRQITAGREELAVLHAQQARIDPHTYIVPAKDGSYDAAALVGASVEWRGSRSSDVGEMVKAMRRAIEQKADGIAVSIVDPQAFNGPTALALARGIPVVSYNADGGKSNKRLAYYGQDNYQSGLELGARLVTLVERGDVYLFIATPRQQNIQPRIDGALDAIRDSGRPIVAHVVATGVDVAGERRKIEATYKANRGLRGLFAVDAGSTAGVAEVMRKYRLHDRGVRAGGY